jgi:RNA polymerase sigma factor (sigma-70 family)
VTAGNAGRAKVAGDEAAVVARAIDGEVAALEEIVHRVQDPVYRLALRMAGRPADAEDATQEILIRIITRLASWRGEASLTTWSYRIAVNYLLSLRRTAIEGRLSFELMDADLADGLASTAYQGPEAELLGDEVRLSCTQAMLQCLDRPLRITYVLGEVFLLPSEEAAWVLDIAPAAYRKRLERARRRIRWFMSGHCGLVNEAAPCRCGKRVQTALARGRIERDHLVFATHPVSAAGPGRAEVADGARQMHRLHDAASVLRRHPDYAAPRDRSEAVLALLRSGRYPLLSEAPPADPSPDLSADRG